MVSPALERILAIQDAELRIDRLRHRDANHPLRAELVLIEADLAQHDAVVEEVESRRQELLKTQKRLQDEVATVEAKRSEVGGKLYGGQVQASKELLALQDEAASLLARQHAFEDDELEIMEAIESVDDELMSLADKRKPIEQRKSGALIELEAAVDDLTSEAAKAETMRDALLGDANPELLARYRSVREQYDGIAVARVINNACEGCHIHLSAVAIDQMNKLHDDAVFTCEECGRILVR